MPRCLLVCFFCGGLGMAFMMIDLLVVAGMILAFFVIGWMLGPLAFGDDDG